MGWFMTIFDLFVIAITACMTIVALIGAFSCFYKTQQSVKAKRNINKIKEREAQKVGK